MNAGSQQGSQQYSVNFVDGSMGLVRACDWRWPEGKPVWTMSTREDVETRWYPDGPLTEEGRQVLLKKFELEVVADELPLDVISRMSPAALLVRHHELEATGTNLHQIHPVSDRIGGHIPAEMAA